MLQNIFMATRRGLIGVTLSALTVGMVHAQPNVMVAGDSISAGFDAPSYRYPLLDALTNLYDCPVSMVGDQTTNNFDFRVDAGPGVHFSPFIPADYDTDHQAFPAIRADQLADGVTTSFHLVKPFFDYVTDDKPDFILVHLGTNDMGQAFRAGILTTDDDINEWLDTTLDDIRDVIQSAIDAHASYADETPYDLRVLVANFIPYARSNSTILTPADLVVAARTSRLFTQRLESMVLDRADARILIVDVETGFDPLTMTPDGIHPNSLGEEHMAGAFLPVLRGAGLCPDTPFITSPASGSTVDGGSTVLQWTNDGVSVSSWRVRVGDTQSGESSTYFDSGTLPGGARSVTVDNLPADLTNVFVSLQYTTTGGVTDQVISSFFNRSGGNAPGLPAMVSPLPGSLLTDTSVNFSWESNDGEYTAWFIRVGSTPGQDTPFGDQYFSFRFEDESTRSTSVSGLPADGSDIYLELSAKRPDGGWDIQIFAYRAMGAGLPEKVLMPGDWYQVSLPYNPGTSNRVRDVFGDALPVNDYATTGANGSWVVFAYDLDATSQLSDTYRRMGLDDRMQVGEGYWVQHALSGSVTLTAPSGASANGSNVTSTACENPGSCFAVPANSAITDGRSDRFAMLGYPLPNPTTALRLRVGTNNNIGCSGTTDCSLAEAFDNDLLFETVFAYRPELNTYALIGPLKGMLNPWDGFWAAQITAAAGQNATLIMSEPGS